MPYAPPRTSYLRPHTSRLTPHALYLTPLGRLKTIAFLCATSSSIKIPWIGAVKAFTWNLHLEALQKTVAAVHPLTEAEWNDFAAGWQLIQYKRKAIITAAGETEKYLYFVLEGVQRGFYAKEDKEVTIVFTYPPASFSGIIDSFLLQQPSRYFLETLTSSTLLRASFTHLQKQMDQYHNVERWVRKSLAITVAGILERQIELTYFSAEEKFRTLLKRSPHLLQLIPHKYLASYLGLDPTTFSKLMGSIRL